MNFPWFRRIGFIYLPGTIPGWLIMLSGIALAVYRFITIDRVSHSASDTLRPFFIDLLIIFAIYTLIAFLTSSVKKNKKNLSDQL